MNAVVVIQARMGSTRLPGKVLLDLEGMPVLWHVIRRVQQATLPSHVLVATTNGTEDDKIEVACQSWGVQVYRGDSDDVLKRFCDAITTLELKQGRIDYIVRITADCPLIDPEIIDSALKIAASEKYDYVSNADPPTFPDGLDVEVIERAALFRACKNAILPSEREHVTPYIRNMPSFHRYNLAAPIDLSSKRWTLDEVQDLHFIREIYRNLYQQDGFFTTVEILAFLATRPDLEEINAKIRRNEGYEKTLQRDADYIQVKK